MKPNVKNNDDYIDKVVYGNNKNDLLEEVKENKDLYKHLGKYQIVTMSNEKWFRITQSGRSFLPEVFADFFCKSHNLYVCEDNYYIYSGGYYKLITKRALMSLIEEELRKFEYVDLKSNWTNEALSRIESKEYISIERFDKYFNNYENIINVKNGIIKFDFKSGSYEFLDHSEEYKTTIQLDVKYNPDEKDLTNWYNFIDTSLNDEKEKMLLQELMGYCFINHLSNNAQNIYCIHGEGGNGKGTTRRILNKILGTKNYVDVKANLLTDSEKQNQFFGFQFKDKLLLGTTETNYEFKDLSLLKSLSGGDTQSSEVKGANQTVDYDFMGKIILSTNDKIKIRDTSKGTKRRLKFLKMDNDIKKPISDLDKRLLNEKTAIFNWCLDGLKRLIKNDFIHTLPDSHFEIFDRYMEHSNNYLRFIRNHIKGGKGIIKTEIFKLFNEQFGNIYRNKDELYSNFEKELKNENINFEIKQYNGVKSVFNGESKNTISYVGIEYVEHKEYEEINSIKIKEHIDCDEKRVIDFLESLDKDKFIKLYKKFNLILENKTRINIFSDQAKSNRGEKFDKILLDNTYDEWHNEVEKADLDDILKMNLWQKLEHLYNSGFNSFLSEYNKNSTNDESKVEFLKNFDTDSLPTTVSEFINS